jgi:hypothetical protein
MPSPLPPLARAPRRAIAVFWISTVAVLAVVGCAKDRASNSSSLQSDAAATRLLGPDPLGGMPPWPDLQRRGNWMPYPLAAGNRWDYTIHTITTTVIDAVRQLPDTTESPWLALVGDPVMVDGRRYFLQSESDPRVMAPSPAVLFLTRQDRTGLYERDVYTAVPAAAGSESGAGAALGERLAASVARMPGAASHPEAFRRAAFDLAGRLEWMMHPALTVASPNLGPTPPALDHAALRYPLYVGASWIYRDSPQYTRRVTSREPLAVPAGRFTAWRIAGGSELFGPRDRVTFWYGSAGLLRIQAHAEVNAVDSGGNIIGTVLVDSDQVLTAAKLHDPSPIRGYAAQEDAEQ